MRVFNSFVTVLVLTLAFAAAASAQAVTKIGFINTNAFNDAKAGITKLVNANKQIETEFAARFKELQDGDKRLQTIVNELQNMQKLPPAQFNQTAFAAKQEEGERLQRELNYKKQDLERDVPKRRDAVIGPISSDILKVLDEYAAKNSFTAVFDTGKLVEGGQLLTLATTADITKDFITFYNARPATAVAPK